MSTAVINRIRNVIKQRQLAFPDNDSPRRIAERLGVHLVAVYKRESGALVPSADNLLRLVQESSLRFTRS